MKKTREATGHPLFSETITETINNMSDTSQTNMSTNAESAINMTKKKVQETVTRARQEAESALYGGTEYVRKNPIFTIIAAITLGLLLGALLSSRRKTTMEPLQGIRDWLEYACKKHRHDNSCNHEGLRRQMQELGKKLHIC